MTMRLSCLRRRAVGSGEYLSVVIEIFLDYLCCAQTFWEYHLGERNLYQWYVRGRLDAASFQAQVKRQRKSQVSPPIFFFRLYSYAD